MVPATPTWKNRDQLLHSQQQQQQQQQQQLYLHPKLNQIYHKENNKNKMKCMASRNNHQKLMRWGSHP